MKYLKYLIVILALLSMGTTWEQYVDNEIKHHQQMELEEKRIEVLARLEKMNATTVNVNSHTTKVCTETKNS